MTTRTPTTRLLALAALGTLLAATPAAGEEPAATRPAAMVEVRHAPKSDTAQADGTFVPAVAVEVAPRFEAYGGPLEIVAVRPLGRVHEGDLLVRFDTQWIDEQIEDKRLAVELAETGLHQKELDAERAEEVVGLELENAERRRDRAEDELRHFLDVDRPLRIAEAEHRIEGWRHRIRDQEEELEQLEKMYAGDDLTEETEEIVLRRARRSLARSRESLEFQERRHELLVERELPREHEDKEYTARKAVSDFERVEGTAEARIHEARLELEKARHGLQGLEDDLEKLLRDRESLELRSPLSGEAVAGVLRGGKWSNLEAMGRQLEAGERVKARHVLLTVARGVSARALFPEADAFWITAGQRATVEPAVAVDALDGEVAAAAPMGENGKYEVLVALEDPDARLRPGMRCTVKVHDLDQPPVLAVPASAVAERKGKRLVWVWDEGRGELVEVPVEVGEAFEDEGDDYVRIEKGLEKGQRVRREAPRDEAGGKDAKKDAGAEDANKSGARAEEPEGAK